LLHDRNDFFSDNDRSSLTILLNPPNKKVSQSLKVSLSNNHLDKVSNEEQDYVDLLQDHSFSELDFVQKMEGLNIEGVERELCLTKDQSEVIFKVKLDNQFGHPYEVVGIDFKRNVLNIWQYHLF
jgi:hypothetical protein